jgi:hypothetical protein
MPIRTKAEYLRQWRADRKARKAKKAARVKAAHKPKPRLPSAEQLAKVLIP